MSVCAPPKAANGAGVRHGANRADGSGFGVCVLRVRPRRQIPTQVAHVVKQRGRHEHITRARSLCQGSRLESMLLLRDDGVVHRLPVRREHGTQLVEHGGRCSGRCEWMAVDQARLARHCHLCSGRDWLLIRHLRRTEGHSLKVLDQGELPRLECRALVAVVLIPQVAFALRIVCQVEQGASLARVVGPRAVRDVRGEDGDITGLHLARSEVKARLSHLCQDAVLGQPDEAFTVATCRKLEATICYSRTLDSHQGSQVSACMPARPDVLRSQHRLDTCN